MNKRLYVDFHILQTVPPSCINRDDTGSPKTAVYGGVLRARVSSQAWKHAMRAAFAENAQLDVGKRTKKAAELVKKQILALAPELDAADKLAKKALENAGIKFDEKSKKDDTVTKALFFMSTAQAKALAELAVEGSADKKQYRDALRAAPSMDMALFGRMVADEPSLNYDAAAQVAHSISTHAVQNEYDYFTAVDDCQAEDNAGAGHLGTVEYNSSTLYRYATVNVMELAGQLGAAQAAETVRAFGEAFLFSMPTGKQNTFANRTLPDAVYVTLREDQPVNLCGAFERAVPRSAQGYAAPSKEALAQYAQQMYSSFAEAPAQSFTVGSGLEELAPAQTAKTQDEKTSYVTYRHYLQDAVFLAGIESEDAALLQQLQQALLHPVFPLYLGRRCCPPTLPLCLGVRPGSLQEVLQAEPPLCPGRQSRILLDADPLEPGTAPQRDVPVSFDPHHRQYGYRSVRELWQKVPDSPETTEHDPFREL